MIFFNIWNKMYVIENNYKMSSSIITHHTLSNYIRTSVKLITKYTNNLTLRNYHIKLHTFQNFLHPLQKKSLIYKALKVSPTPLLNTWNPDKTPLPFFPLKDAQNFQNSPNLSCRKAPRQNDLSSNFNPTSRTAFHNRLRIYYPNNHRTYCSNGTALKIKYINKYHRRLCKWNDQSPPTFSKIKYPLPQSYWRRHLTHGLQFRRWSSRMNIFILSPVSQTIWWLPIPPPPTSWVHFIQSGVWLFCRLMIG